MHTGLLVKQTVESAYLMLAVEPTATLTILEEGAVSVAQHLNIKVSEYDQRIRTFIPSYDEMLSTVAAAVRSIQKPGPLIVDLGIGTGALAMRCLTASPGSRLLGIDADPQMLGLALARLRRRFSTCTELVNGDFVDAFLPRAHAIVATLALHHIRTLKAKQQFYGRCFRSLHRGGLLVSGDCFMADHPRLASQYMETWRAHMREYYSAKQVNKFLAAWANEDTYFTLRQELNMLVAVGFQAEVMWRRAPFAVVVGWKQQAK